MSFVTKSFQSGKVLVGLVKSSVLGQFRIILNNVTMKNPSHPSEFIYRDKLRDILSAVAEVKLPSGKIVDLMSKDCVYEIDFTHKWAESIGQSLQYGYETHRKPCIIFIFDYRKDTDLLCSILPLLTDLKISVFKIDIFSFQVSTVLC